MIYSRSPYYVDIDATSIPDAQRYEMRLYIWKGDFTPIPSTPTYLFNNNLYDSKGMVNISNYINDFLTDEDLVNQNTTGVYAFNGVVNVRWEIDIITSTSTITNHSFGENFSMKGYTKYDEGRNYNFDDSDKEILIDGNYLKTTGNLIIPFETYDLQEYSVKSYPSNTLLINGNIDSVSDSKEKCQYIVLNKNVVPENDTHLLVDIGGFTKTFIIEKECKHTPYYVQFKNRYGVNQLLTFFKKSTTRLNVNKKEFQKKSYVRQIYNYNTNAKKTYNLTTGYQHESINEPIEQLLLSEHVWLSTDAFTWIPVNVDTKSLDYRTKLNDKLISYEITFEQAFNLINNV